MTWAGFDFDAMSKLANIEPTAFVRHRNELIKQLITNSHNPSDMHDLQQSIDIRRIGSAPGIASSRELLDQAIGNMSSIESLATQLEHLLDTAANATKAP